MPSYPNRLATSVPTVDFILMLQEINKEYSVSQIKQITQIPETTIKKTIAETQTVPKAWNEAIALLDIYLKITHKEKIPFI